MPAAVVLPAHRSKSRPSSASAHKYNIPFVSRGAGTGLSGGALPAPGSVVIGLARMNRILNIDLPNQQVTVQPGVINSNVTAAVSAARLLLRARPQLPVRLHHRRQYRRKRRRSPLPQVRLHRHPRPRDDRSPAHRRHRHPRQQSPRRPRLRPPRRLHRLRRHARHSHRNDPPYHPQTRDVQVILAAFDTIAAAAQTVSDVIAAGQLPAAMEIMDRLSIEAAEASVHPNYPACEALLLIELDGPKAEVDLQMAVLSASPKTTAHGRPASPSTSRTASSSGRAAKPPSPPPAVSPRTTSCRTA